MHAAAHMPRGPCNALGVVRHPHLLLWAVLKKKDEKPWQVLTDRSLEAGGGGLGSVNRQPHLPQPIM